MGLEYTGQGAHEIAASDPHELDIGQLTLGVVRTIGDLIRGTNIISDNDDSCWV